MSINTVKKAFISYISPNEFKQLANQRGVARMVGRPERYCFEERVSSKLPMYSLDANTCSILSVNDTMMHLAPERDDVRLMDKLSDFLKEQRDLCGDLNAVLIGGKAPNLYRKSTELYSGIANLLEKEHADYTMICGKQLDLCMDNLYQSGNSFKFTQTGNVGLEELSHEADLTPKRIKEILKYYFKDVKISKKHDLTL